MDLEWRTDDTESRLTRGARRLFRDHVGALLPWIPFRAPLATDPGNIVNSVIQHINNAEEHHSPRTNTPRRPRLDRWKGVHRCEPVQRRQDMGCMEFAGVGVVGLSCVLLPFIATHAS